MSVELVDKRFLGILKTKDVMKPAGITIHYTADRSPERTVKSLASAGLGYHYLVDRDGTVFQLADTNRSVSHAGKAMWLELSNNRSHLAISLLSWGKLTELKDGHCVAWNGLAINKQDIAYRGGFYWDAATPAQEKALVDLLKVLCFHCIDTADICGHDESAIPPGRKTDPGGVLSMTMSELRSKLAEEIKSMEVKKIP